MDGRDMSYQDALLHYGIPGMRWGVRRDVGNDGRVRNNKVAQGKAQKPAEPKVKKQWTPEQKRAAQTVGALAAVGAIVAAEILANPQRYNAAPKKQELGKNLLLPNGWPTAEEMVRR